MKFICKTSGVDEGVENQDFLFLDIDKAFAVEQLEEYRICQEFLLSRNFRFFGEVLSEAPIQLDFFGDFTKDMDLEDRIKNEGVEGWLRMPDDWEPKESFIGRTECHKIRYDRPGIFFFAYHKHSESHADSEDIKPLLEKIANGEL